jgi:hypothetical protein
MHAYILDRVIITVGGEMGPCSRVYAVGYAGFSVCQVMSVPAFGAVVLGMLIQKLEAPKGDGWSFESLAGRFGGAARPASHSDVKSMWRITFGRLVCLGGWPPSSAWSGGAFIWYRMYGSPAVCH